MAKEIVWKSRRNKILNAMDEKMVPIGHVYELQSFDDNGIKTLEDLNIQQQSELYFQYVKSCVLGDYNSYFYPYWDYKKAARIRFKIVHGLHDNIKAHLKKFTHFLRHTIYCRDNISQLLAKKLQLGLVARSIAEVFRDFLQVEFPKIVEEVFNSASGKLNKLDETSQTLRADIDFLASTLRHFVEKELVGGQIISYLDRPDVHQFDRKRSFIPSLFAKCIKAGLVHYNNFLEEFLYNGDIKSDRQHEFMIWDLSKTKIYKASDFYQDKEYYDDLPFDQRFVVVTDLIPSIWKKAMVTTLFHARKIISILVAETRKPFFLPYKNITNELPEKQFEIIQEADEFAGKALVEKIDSIFNIQEFYNLLHEMIFNPSASWLPDFVDEVDMITSSIDELDDYDANKFNHIFMNFFHQRCKKVKENFDLVKMKLYDYSLFEKVLPLDKRFVDYVLIESEMEKEDEGINDENQPIINNKSVSLEDATRSSGKTSLSPLEDPKQASENDDDDAQVEATELPFIERIGIEFSNFVLFKCLVPPPIQEHFNRLFRLRFSLVRANLLLLQKRYLSESADIYSNRSEQIFITVVQNFISRYTFFVFGILCGEQWKIFKDTTPNLKSINTITEAQRFLLRNINSSAGLYNNSQRFSDNLMMVLQTINGYCLGEMNFNDAADQFYKAYKSMRAIVCSKGNEYLDKMSYEVFRVPPLVRLNQIEKVELDPRKGLVAVPNVNGALSTMRRSISMMSVQRRMQ
jgi:hypothetical protein